MLDRAPSGPDTAGSDAKGRAAGGERRDPLFSQTLHRGCSSVLDRKVLPILPDRRAPKTPTLPAPLTPSARITSCQ